MLTTNNDKNLKIFDINKISESNYVFTLANCINHAEFSPDYKLIGTYSDQTDA